MYDHTTNEVSRLTGSKVIAQTDTNRQTETHTYTHTQDATKQKLALLVMKHTTFNRNSSTFC